MLGYLFPTLLAVLASVALARWLQLQSQRSTEEEQLREALQKYGLQSPSGFGEATVSVVGPTMQLVSNASFKLGSANAMDAPELLRATQVEALMPMPDVVVCKRSIAPAVFGAFVPATVPTGAPAFDQVYGVFFANGAGPRSPHALQWLDADVMSRMLTSNLVGLQAANGQVRFAVGAIAGSVSNGVLESAHAVALWAAIRHAVTGEGARPPLARDAFPAVAESNIADYSSMAGLGLSILSALVVGFEPALFGMIDIVCPEGGSFHSGRANHTNYCRVDGHNSYKATMWPTYLCWIAMTVLIVTVIFSAGLRSMIARTRKARLVLTGV